MLGTAFNLVTCRVDPPGIRAIVCGMRASDGMQIKGDPIDILQRSEERALELLYAALETDVADAAALEKRALAMLQCVAMMRQLLEGWHKPADFPRFDRYDEALAFVVHHQNASVSAIQRGLSISFNEAARYIERMELAEAVSAPGADGRRQVLYAREIKNAPFETSER